MTTVGIRLFLSLLVRYFSPAPPPSPIHRPGRELAISLQKLYFSRIADAENPSRYSLGHAYEVFSVRDHNAENSNLINVLYDIIKCQTYCTKW